MYEHTDSFTVILVLLLITPLTPSVNATGISEPVPKLNDQLFTSVRRFLSPISIFLHFSPIIFKNSAGSGEHFSSTNNFSFAPIRSRSKPARAGKETSLLSSLYLPIQWHITSPGDKSGWGENG